MAKLAEADSGAPRSLQVFTKALHEGRLAHAILIHGDHPPALEAACLELAGRLLNASETVKHPDFFPLRPGGKARTIKVDALRDFLRKIQLTASAGPRKVGVVYEADRMPAAAANAFLKTLEEPPADTTLFLLTTRPNDLLPTIRSRCFHLKLPAASAALTDADWLAWRSDYSAWLGRLLGGEKSRPSDLVLGAYGLGARFEGILQRLGDAAWEKTKAELPATLDDEEIDAAQAGLHKGMRTSLLVEIEQTTRDFALAAPGDAALVGRALRLGRAVGDLEKISGLLEVNLNEAAALEFFLLRSLRHWTAKN